jgi:rhodanese-related sulfurtransferase
MKNKAFVSMLLMVFLIPFSSTYASEGEHIVLPDLPRISVEELKRIIDNGEDVVSLDVRDSYSYRVGHIKGAINIYYDSTADPMERQMMMLALPMDRLIVIYCDCTDDASSAYMAQELFRLGYDRDKVKILSGGSLRWVELDYPLMGTI